MEKKLTHKIYIKARTITFADIYSHQQMLDDKSGMDEFVLVEVAEKTYNKYDKIYDDFFKLENKLEKIFFKKRYK